MKKLKENIDKKLEELDNKANRDFINAKLDLDLTEWFNGLGNDEKLSIYKSQDAYQSIGEDDLSFN